MLAEGFTTRRGRRGALIHRDAVNRMLRGRRGARLTALTSGGTIPDTADYEVLLEPEYHASARVNEDFAVESMARRHLPARQHVAIASCASSAARCASRTRRARRRPFRSGSARRRGAATSCRRCRGCARTIATRLRGSERRRDAWLARRRRSASPSRGRASSSSIISPPRMRRSARCRRSETLVIERFFDESGGTQLVIHSPFGSRINRAWGLALRKRFCRKFNFELQAAATEDAIVLSLVHATASRSTTSRATCIRPRARGADPGAARRADVRHALALERDVALALPRFLGGRKVAPQLQRMRAEDLLAAVFPDQVACAENLVGEREMPDHPLVAQTIARLPRRGDGHRRARARAARASRRATSQVVARDLTAAVAARARGATARPYAFLDDAPLEERRTQAVMSRRWLAPGDRRRPRPARRRRDRARARGGVARAAQRRRAARCAGVARLLTEDEARAHGLAGWLAALARRRRVDATARAGTTFWVAAERLPQFQRAVAERDARSADRARRALCGADLVARRRAGRDRARPARRSWAGRRAALAAARARAGATSRSRSPRSRPKASSCAAASRRAPRGRMVRAPPARAHPSLHGQAAARRDRAGRGARLHALPASMAARDAEPRMKGPDALAAVLAQLEGFEAPAGAVGERDIAGARSPATSRPGSTTLCLAGRVAWTRLRAAQRRSAAAKAARPAGAHDADHAAGRAATRRLGALAPAADGARARASRAQRGRSSSSRERRLVLRRARRRQRLLRTESRTRSAELVARGRVTSDSFAGLRALLVPSSERKR